MTKEESKRLYEAMERKRLQIGDCLFSAQRHVHSLSNARKLVKLASELAELVALIEHDV